MKKGQGYEVDNNVLYLKENGIRKAACRFTGEIDKVLDFESIFVVMIKVPPKGKCNENVFGISPEGTINWQIQPRSYVYKDSPYTGMCRVQDKVKLFNWDGLELVVDPESGKILEEKCGK